MGSPLSMYYDRNCRAIPGLSDAREKAVRVFRAGEFLYTSRGSLTFEALAIQDGALVHLCARVSHNPGGMVAGAGYSWHLWTMKKDPTAGAVSEERGTSTRRRSQDLFLCPLLRAFSPLP